MAIIQTRPGALETLPQTLLQIMVNKQQLEQEKERLGLAKKDQELRAETAAAQQQRQQDMIAGANAAANVFLQDPNVSPQVRSTVQGLSPGAIGPFLEGLQDFRGTAAANRTGAAGARVAEGTETSVIDKARSDATVAAAGASVAGAKAQSDLNNTVLRNMFLQKSLDDPEGAELIQSWVRSAGQLTWSETKEALGVVSEDNIPPKLRFKPLVTISPDASRAAGFLPLMKSTNSRINVLNENGVRLSFPSALRQGSRVGVTINSLLNLISDEDQRALVTANRSFADFWRFSLSGQQSGEAERLSMMLSITEEFADGDAVIAQKRDLRQTMITSMEQVVAGAMSPLQAANAALDIATRLGDTDVTAAFTAYRDGIIEAGPSNIPGLGTQSAADLVSQGVGN